MTDEPAFEARAIPELSELVEAVACTERARVLALDGKPAARLAPLRRWKSGRSSGCLVETTVLAPVPDDALDRLLNGAPVAAQRSFTDDEIRDALDQDRADA
jgi:antitoxin (DNA-binding transcriptional repressor) of toxin-antitoxin stability system